MSNTKKVAELANVSVATVSRVINNNGKVALKTRRKVEAAIKELNYVPNMLARNFRTAASKSIIVMVTNISNYFYMETIHGISEYAHEKGYDILLSETNEEKKRQYEGFLKVKNHIADGVIIIESTIKDRLLISLEKEFPVVQCSVYSQDVSIPFVAIDNVRGGYIGTKMLIDQGHENIAFIGTENKSMYNEDRIKGYLKALKEANIEKHRIIYTQLSIDGGSEIAQKLIKEKEAPTALFFASDMPAIGAIHGLTAAGYNVPGDISILGFDNIELCSLVLPGLTTVAQPMYEIGRESARLLIERIESNTSSSPRNIIFQPQIVKRNSIAKPKTFKGE